MKEIGDAMGDATGYTSQYGFQLYDTAGTTEDWNYAAAGRLRLHDRDRPGGRRLPHAVQDGRRRPVDRRTTAERGQGPARGAADRRRGRGQPRATTRSSRARRWPGRSCACARTSRRTTSEPFCKRARPGLRRPRRDVDARAASRRSEPFTVPRLPRVDAGRAGRRASSRGTCNPSTRPFVGKDKEVAGRAGRRCSRQVEQGDGSAAPVRRDPTRDVPVHDHRRRQRTNLTVDLTWAMPAEDYDLELCGYDGRGLRAVREGLRAPRRARRATSPAQPEHIEASREAHGDLTGDYVATVVSFASASDEWTLTTQATKPGSIRRPCRARARRGRSPARRRAARRARTARAVHRPRPAERGRVSPAPARRARQEAAEVAGLVHARGKLLCAGPHARFRYSRVSIWHGTNRGVLAVLAVLLALPGDHRCGTAARAGLPLRGRTRNIRTTGGFAPSPLVSGFYGCLTDVGRAYRLDTGTLRARSSAMRQGRSSASATGLASNRARAREPSGHVR